MIYCRAENLDTVISCGSGRTWRTFPKVMTQWTTYRGLFVLTYWKRRLWSSWDMPLHKVFLHHICSSSYHYRKIHYLTPLCTLSDKMFLLAGLFAVLTCTLSRCRQLYGRMLYTEWFEPKPDWHHLLSVLSPLYYCCYRFHILYYA